MGSKSEVQVGKKFGLWTVLEIEVKNPNSGAKRVRKGALCQCECGTQRYKEYRDLYDGRSTSCGCNGQTNAINSLIQKGSIKPGTVFGKLTVIEDLGMIEGTHYCKCQCACGQETIVSNTHLKAGHTQSCGCLKSKGELEITTLLRQAGYEFAKEYAFPDLKSDKNYPLRFDFAVLENKKLLKLIEFDGPQHHTGQGWFQDEFQNIIKRDNQKDQYCREKEIELIRVPYTKLGKITLVDLGFSKD